MQAKTERYEMRLDEDLLSDINAWRARQGDVPPRAEAIRRLIEKGLVDNQRQIQFTKGETLIIQMLCDVFKGLKIKSEIDPNVVQAALSGGHMWGLKWKYSWLFPDQVDSPDLVEEVTDILHMWDYIEVGYEKLSRKEKERVAKSTPQFNKADDVTFDGFDGNNEHEYYSVALFLIKDLERFPRFGGERLGLDSHMPRIELYRRMLQVFQPMRSTLAGGDLSASQVIEILKARIHPSRRGTSDRDSKE
jgi:uncharacterized protein YfbU (UPF0304 family)